MISIRKSLKAQLLAGILFFSILPLIIVGVLAYDSGKTSMIKSVKRHLESVAILKKQAIDNWIEHLNHSLSWMVNTTDVIENAKTLVSPENSRDTLPRAHRSLVKEFQRITALGHLSQISFLDKDTGQVMASSNPSWEGKFRENELFFRQARKGPYVSEIFLSLSIERPTLVVSGPVKDPEGKLLGVIAAHVNFDRLSEIMMERTGLSNTTETFLVNKSNLLITSTVFAPDGAFKKWIFGEGAKRAIAGQSGVDIFQDYRDKKVIGAYLWLPERKLALIAKQDAKEALAGVAALGRKIFYIGFAVSLIVIFLSFLLTRKITTPLLELVKGAHAIGRGDLDYRVGSNAIDEIGILSAAFDDMARDLKAITISRDEKEVLLREIHHRVKNNLQMIQSLLSLQMNRIEDENLIGLLKESINRISSIAMVHETLYKSKDLSTIDLSVYFNDLIGYLFKSIGSSESLIDFDCAIEQVPMDLDAVVACGLIINELVTNALKYAFVKKNSGRICIALRRLDPTEACLVVSDNGVGMSCMDRTGKRTLGIDLVTILAEKQLEGSISLNQETGLAYQIRFPIKSVIKE